MPLGDDLLEPVNLSLQPRQLANQSVGNQRDIFDRALLFGTRLLCSIEPQLHVPIETLVKTAVRGLAHRQGEVPKTPGKLAGNVSHGRTFALAV